MTAHAAPQDDPSGRTAGTPGWLQQLATALPGVSGAQLSRFLPPATGGRHSAVLVLFGEGPAGPDVLLIERAHTLRAHAGQPAFPGGALDPEDGSPTGPGPVAAALREAREEVGLDPASVQVLGQLPALFLPPSGFVVHPVVGHWHAPHRVHVVDEAEVAAVLRVPLTELSDPGRRLQVRHPAAGRALPSRSASCWCGASPPGCSTSCSSSAGGPCRGTPAGAGPWTR